MRNAMFAGVALAILLAGCGQTKLVGRSLPDETRVIDGPSLAVPPDLALRPPREGGDYETLLRAQKSAEARALITGVSATTVGASGEPVPSTDSWLVESTGTVVNPGIRDELERAAVNPAEEKKSGLMDRWFGRNKE